MAKARILVVEDEDLNVLYFKELFKDAKLNCLFAKDAKEAIQFVRDNSKIDLVLMDIKLPGMDGYKATRKVKEFRKDLPVIAQTARAYNEDKIKCFEAGCDDYISKPINKDVLYDIMKKQLYK